MAEVECQKLLKQFGRKIQAAAKHTAVRVGYTANYALFVHENLEAAHGAAFNAKHAAEIAAGTEHSRGDNQQAKFLETPFRQLRPQLQAGIVADLKAGRTMPQALLKAGLRLQRESQLICPVDKGNLKNSAFTKLE